MQTFTCCIFCTMSLALIFYLSREDRLQPFKLQSSYHPGKCDRFIFLRLKPWLQMTTISQCQIIIKNNKHTSFRTRVKWILFSPRWSIETSWCIWLKLPEKKSNWRNLNNVYLRLFFLTFGLYLSLDRKI